MHAIKTIGHSNHPIERFVDLLKAGGVEAVVDVRSMPYSRRFPQFGRERLAQVAGRGRHPLPLRRRGAGRQTGRRRELRRAGRAARLQGGARPPDRGRRRHHALPDVRREGTARLPSHGAGVAPPGRTAAWRSSTCWPTAARPHHERRGGAARRQRRGPDLFDDGGSRGWRAPGRRASGRCGEAEVITAARRTSRFALAFFLLHAF